MDKLYIVYNGGEVRILCCLTVKSFYYLADAIEFRNDFQEVVIVKNFIVFVVIYCERKN